MAEKIPTEIDVFLGLNENISGSTQLKLGESDYMYNFRVTDLYKLRKLRGYARLFDTIQDDENNNCTIRGMWYGKILGAYRFLFACNGHVYTLSDKGEYASIGELTDADTFFFFFNSKVYILNGSEYKCWDGLAFKDVGGYVPVVAINTPPAGGGTQYESINLLTGSKRQWFSPDGEAKDFFITEKNIDSIDWVKNRSTGETLTVETDYTVDLEAGKVTTVGVLTDVENLLEIKWTKGEGNREAIEKCRKAIVYGGENDTRVFMWGNPDNQNRRYHSEFADLMYSAEYFPATNYYDIGTDEFMITDIVKQYDRQIILTNGGKAFYSYYDNGSFPVYPLNDAVGNVAFGQAQLVLNNPFSVYNGVYQWISTTVRDERNAQYMSKRVQPSLDEVDLSDAITYDYEKLAEYWLCVDKTIWVYNYRLDVWYKFILLDTPTCFIEIEGEMYFGTDSGTIMKFDEEMRTFNGQSIASEWHMGFYDSTAEWLRKYLNYTHISLKPEPRSLLDVYWETNRQVPKDEPKIIGYTNLWFEDIDFDDWSFEGNYNPQPFRVKTKAKKWVYFKLILKNDSDLYTAHILSINLMPQLGGISK